MKSKSKFAGLALALALLGSAATTFAKTYTMRVYLPGLQAAGSVQPPGVSDPDFASVTFLAHMDGANGSASVVDVKGHAISNSGATISTAQSVSDGASLFLNTGNRLTTPASSAFTFTGDFTLEAWLYPTAAPNFAALLDTWTQSGGYQIAIESGSLCFYYSGNSGVVCGGSLSLNVWHHVAVSRVSGTLRLFIDGSPVASTPYTGTVSPAQPYLALNYQQQWGPEFYFPGYLDEVRITNGVARYVSNFTPPTGAFPDQ